MKILIHDYSGHPFQVQLSRKLAERGHTVLHLYAGSNNTPKGSLEKTATDTSGFDCHPITIHKPLQKYNFLRRWQQEHEYGKLLAHAVIGFKPDMIISAGTPLDAQADILKAARHIDACFIFWLQDLNGQATYTLLKKKIPIIGHVIGKYYINLEKHLLRCSDHIILISGDFLPYLAQCKIPPQQSTVIPNWGPLAELPVKNKVNPWSIAHGISEKLLFLYTGALGMKHNPELLLRLAQAFQENDAIRVVVASEGLGANWLREAIKRLRLNNLLIIEFQPMKDLANMLAAGDVLIAILDSQAGIYSVPSKVFSYLCAQRALLLSMPTNNLAARVVQTNKAGIVVSSENIEEFIAAARELIVQPALREQYALNARRYAEENFDIEKITDRFELLAKQQKPHLF